MRRLICLPYLRQSFPCRYWTLKSVAFSSSFAASYTVSIRQASVLPAASSRFHLAMDTLAARLTIPPAGFVEDFHLQMNAPCRAHNKKGRVDPGLSLLQRFSCVNRRFEALMLSGVRFHDNDQKLDPFTTSSSAFQHRGVNLQLLLNRILHYNGGAVTLYYYWSWLSVRRRRLFAGRRRGPLRCMLYLNVKAIFQNG